MWVSFLNDSPSRKRQVNHREKEALHVFYHLWHCHAASHAICAASILSCFVGNLLSVFPVISTQLFDTTKIGPHTVLDMSAWRQTHLLKIALLEWMERIISFSKVRDKKCFCQGNRVTSSTLPGILEEITFLAYHLHPKGISTLLSPCNHMISISPDILIGMKKKTHLHLILLHPVAIT